MILKFEKLYSRDRKGQPCFVSIPLAKGRLSDESSVSLWQQGSRLPVQKKVLSRYPDGSIRYLFLRFLADIPANKGTVIECTLGEPETEESIEYKGEADGSLNESHIQVQKAAPVITCKKTPCGYEVATGRLTFEVANGSSHLFETLSAFGRTYTKEQFIGPVLQEAAKEQPYFMTYGDWKVVEEGEVCVILSNQGKLLMPEAAESETAEGETAEGNLWCEARITAYAGRSAADMEFRLINAAETALPIGAYSFVLSEDAKTEAVVRTCAASSNYKTDFVISETGEKAEKSITADLLLNEGNEHFTEVFYGTFFADRTDDKCGVCATVYQAQQNFPKAVSADKAGIVIQLVPNGSTPVVMQSGMAVSQSFQLYFHDKEEELQEINHKSILYQMPDRPILAPEVYEASGLFPDMFVEKDRQDSEVECALIMAGDNHGRSFGMMNFGDVPDAHYTAQGRGGGELVWSNNEYDFPHACMLQYVRTGIRRFMDYCLVNGTHQRDVDVCHYSKNELLLGGQWEHTRGHCVKGVIVCSHEWVEGLLDCYHMTGDTRFYETAIGIGENVLRLLDTPAYQQNGGLNARETGWALRTLTALYKETFDKKWTEKSEWIVGQFEEWHHRYDGWLAPYTDNTVIRVPFMISVAIGSLMRYYREFPAERIKKMILHAVDDMVEHCLMDNGYFFYKELPSLNRIGNNPLVLEALAIAYELTKDKKYLQFGEKTFKAAIQASMAAGSSSKKAVEDAVIMGNMSTKRYGQMYIPVVTYYKAWKENDF